MSRIELSALQGCDDDVFTLNDGEYLWLHFDGRHVQSAMNISDPFKLCFSYVQAMMAFKLFNAAPDKILIVGLGGGSLSKYCYRRFPLAQIKTVEISSDVMALRDKFHIPHDDERFQVVLADAASYIPNLTASEDVLLVDAYTATGLPDALCTASYFRSCYHALAPEGILVMNLVDSEPRYCQVIRLISEVFAGNCLITYVEDCGNYILVARKSRRPLRDGASNDVERREIKLKRGVGIPQFRSLDKFYEQVSY